MTWMKPAVGTVLILALCSSCSGEKPTESTADFDQQRYDLLREVLIGAVTECCRAMQISDLARVEVDTSRMPELQWPFFAASVPVDSSELTFSDRYRNWASRENDTAAITYFWEVKRSKESGFILPWAVDTATTVLWIHSYTWDDLTGENPSRWVVRFTSRVDVLDEQTLRATASATFDYYRDGKCQDRPCDHYFVSINGFSAMPAVAGNVQLTSGELSAELTETRTSGLFDSQAAVVWNIRGHFDESGQIAIAVTSGGFTVFDTLTFCP